MKSSFNFSFNFNYLLLSLWPGLLSLSSTSSPASSEFMFKFTFMLPWGLSLSLSKLEFKLGGFHKWRHCFKGEEGGRTKWRWGGGFGESDRSDDTWARSAPKNYGLQLPKNLKKLRDFEDNP